MRLIDSLIRWLVGGSMDTQQANVQWQVRIGVASIEWQRAGLEVSTRHQPPSRRLTLVTGSWLHQEHCGSELPIHRGCSPCSTLMSSLTPNSNRGPDLPRACTNAPQIRMTEHISNNVWRGTMLGTATSEARDFVRKTNEGTAATHLGGYQIVERQPMRQDQIFFHIEKIVR